VTHGLRLAYAGTPELAAVILARLLDDGRHPVEHVFTQPDRRAGRGRKPVTGPVKALALERGLAVSQPRTAAQLDRHPALAEADLLVVVAYGLILSETTISRPRYGSVNVHTSLLPRWRGAAPIQRAIEAGDERTGITIMQMDAGLDTGPVLLQRECPISPDDTAATLHDRLALLGGDCLLEALDALAAGRLSPHPQDEGRATYAAKISKAEAEIDWSRPAAEIERRIRAFNPEPVAHTRLNGQPMRVWRATQRPGPAGAEPGRVVGFTPAGLDVATGSGVLRILDLQLPGKRPVNAAEFHRGHPRFAAC
jgi:methionyl-tRNA formyltransferase